MRIITFFILGTVCAVCLMIAASQSFAGSDPDVHIFGQKMSLKADGVPLQNILEKIRHFGIDIKIDSGINPAVTGDFEGKDIQEALDQIIGGNNYALVWKKNESGEIELSGITVYRQGWIGDTAPPVSSGNLAIERDKATGAIYVKNKILVRFKAPVDEKRILKILKKLKAVLKLVHKGMALYEIILPDGTDTARALAFLMKEGSIGTAESDYAYKVPVPLPYWGGSGLPDSTSAAARPPGETTVAVLDSGLDAGFLSSELNRASFDALASEETGGDTVGHGTQMALIASGQVAPMGVESAEFVNPVISIRVFDENGYTSNTVLIRSIDYAIANGAVVLSLSWGSETPSAFLKQAMDYAVSKGLKVVAASGNTPTGKPVYPAAYEPVIAVSALAPDGKDWDQSNYGEFVDIAAPGFANLPIGYQGEPGTYAGTSIATAYVAGRIAAQLEKQSEKN